MTPLIPEASDCPFDHFWLLRQVAGQETGMGQFPQDPPVEIRVSPTRQYEPFQRYLHSTGYHWGVCGVSSNGQPSFGNVSVLPGNKSPKFGLLENQFFPMFPGKRLSELHSHIAPSFQILIFPH